jgi:hypothetical protein
MKVVANAPSHGPLCVGTYVGFSIFCLSSPIRANIVSGAPEVAGPFRPDVRLVAGASVEVASVPPPT